MNCWSANSPNPPQPITPKRMRSSSMDANLVDESTSGELFLRARHAAEGLNPRPLYPHAGVRTPGPGETTRLESHRIHGPVAVRVRVGFRRTSHSSVGA